MTVVYTLLLRAGARLLESLSRGRFVQIFEGQFSQRAGCLVNIRDQHVAQLPWPHLLGRVNMDGDHCQQL